MASGNPESEKILSDEDNVVDSEELGRYVYECTDFDIT